MHPSLLWIPFVFAFVAAQGTDSQCASGEVVCCNTVKEASAVVDIPVIVGISNGAAAEQGLVGSECTKLTVMGLPTGKSCVGKQIPVCCADNSYGGVLSLGCAYIDPLVIQVDLGL